MSDSPDSTPARGGGPLRYVAVVVVLAVAGVGAWWYTTQGRQVTDDAQVDAYVTPIAARVGGTVAKVPVADNQLVEAGAVLLELDPRDLQLAVDRAKANLADAEASALAADSHVPITSTTATSGVTAAEGMADQARGAVETARREVEAARARLGASQARLREAETHAARTAKDAERLKGLAAKDQIAQQQYDMAVAAAEAQRAATDTARAGVSEAETAIKAVESRLNQAIAGEQAARASLKGAQVAPEQITAMRAQAASAQARVEQAKVAVAQAQLTLEYATVKAPARGIVSKRSVQPGQIVQPGQPVLALVLADEVWVTANFKETQVADMRVGQRVSLDVDALRGRTFEGRIESLAAATGARFSLLPPENATGNFVKVVQRIPVRIAVAAGQDPDRQLKPGMSVLATVFTE